MIPGEIITVDGDLELNTGRRITRLSIANTGDRPIQVGSHYHFAETNPALRFERAQARGCRLDIPAGTAVRLEPGQEKEVTLTAFGGARQLSGLNSLTEGQADDPGPRGQQHGGDRAENVHLIRKGPARTLLLVTPQGLRVKAAPC